ncbi:hypothetical protein BQ8420_05430 [Nocardiopsis sp. JB363]|nr:hypothetical protein BQ8420_05430 [Nocardiopsis sp. JB363]
MVPFAERRLSPGLKPGVCAARKTSINAIFDKFGLAHTPEYSRRVLAVLRFLST